jgi:CubicO group peptidase (beta-lactamase class C family)
MRAARAIVKYLLAATLMLMLALVAWLWLAPPELIRVGSNYAAKIVCSNVFLARRDAAEVLADDVQAPGHPLLRLMRASVDEEAGEVRTGLFGFMGGGHAVYREGLGCTVVPDGAGLQPLTAPVRAGFVDEEDATLPDPELSALLDDNALVGPGMRATIVFHDGRILAERYGEGFAADTPLIGWSMSKTVVGALIGALVGEGKLSLDESGLFPQWRNDARSSITTAHLLGMESGLSFNENYGNVSDVTRMLYLEPDMAAFVASLAAEARPGERFRYSSGTSVLLSRIWQEAFDTDSEALQWAYRSLFDPLGMANTVLEVDASGTSTGSSYIYATGCDWVRFAELLLDDGVWQGRRILPEGWVDWMRAPTQASGGEYGRHVWLHGPRRGPDWSSDPDAGFDLPADAFWLIGHDGQTVTILPSLRLIVLRMGLTPSNMNYRPQLLVQAVVQAIGSRIAD